MADREDFRRILNDENEKNSDEETSLKMETKFCEARDAGWFTVIIYIYKWIVLFRKTDPDSLFFFFFNIIF